MDDLLLKQLVRQLKIINFWITLFGTLFLVTLVIVGIMLFKLVTFVHHTEQSLTDLQQKTQSALDIQQKLCDSKGIGSLLSDKTSACK